MNQYIDKSIDIDFCNLFLQIRNPGILEVLGFLQFISSDSESGYPRSVSMMGIF